MWFETQIVGFLFGNSIYLQEELAFMFEMLGLFDDALIQYDELDALFTQFVLNHASGGNSYVTVQASVIGCKFQI